MNDEEQEIIEDVEPTTEPDTEPDPITGETEVEDESEEFDEDMTEETPQDGDNTEDLRAVTALATRTVQVDEIITDYSAESLAAYEADGFTAYAVYDDGTEEQVAWADVSEPPTLNDVISLEGLDVAMANNQHFWQRSTDPDQDGAGTGAFVTDDEQDAFLEAAADGFDDLSDQKPWHNLLINSLGILLRTGLNNLVSITRSAIAFFDGRGNAASNIVARFGKDGFQVGLDGESHLIGDYHSLQLLDKEGNAYFHVSDLRDESGTIEQNTSAKMSYAVQDGSGNALISLNTPPIQTLKSVYYYTGEAPNLEKHTITSSSSTDSFGRLVVPVSLDVPDGAILYIKYITASYLAKAYTLGIRSDGYSVGLMSCAIGEDVKAQGRYAYAEGKDSEARAEATHAEGYGTYATGRYSHAEGSHTGASGEAAHAEGEYSAAAGEASHAEGHHTVASGGDSHAEGSYSTASGGCSHAQNAYTIAASDNQTALGKYNVEDSSGDYAVIVGNGAGTSSSQRSNALTTDWDGIVGAQNVGMYGTCDTAAATAAKVATLDDYGVTFKLVKGAVVRIYMANSNTVADPTLNVNSTGAKAIKRYGTTAPSTASGSSWIGGTVMTFLYDGTYWRLCDYRNNDNTIPSAYCSTAAATAAKAASCSGYVLLSKSFLHVIMTASNTAASALTFNVNGKGAKPIYINGTASSSSNYTLPAGSYLVYYNGTNYYFRTDGLLTASITGTASNVTGTVAIGHGGTGNTATTTTTTLSEICTAGTNITLSSGSYSYWGKVASFSIVFKPTAAITSGSTVFTMVSGKRPDLYSIGNDTNSTYPCSIDTNGKVYCRRALTSGTTYTFRATYLLA